MMFGERNQRSGRIRNTCRKAGQPRLPQGRSKLVSAPCPVASAARVSPAITVCILSHNGGTRLASLFSALARQTLPFYQWEVLVLDLHSTDDTSEAARRNLLGKCGGRGRVVRVEQPGLAWARARAAREASGEIICFLEDHQHPAPDFLAAVVQAFAEHPRAGIMGGIVLHRSDTVPGPLVKVKVPGVLGWPDMSDRSRCLPDLDNGVPGAGLCIRRSVLLSLVSSPAPEFKRVNHARNGSINPVDCGISAAARQMGWQCWYVPALKLQEVRPAEGSGQPGQPGWQEEMGGHPTAFPPVAWLEGLIDFCRRQLDRWRSTAPALGQSPQALAAGLGSLKPPVWPGPLHPAKAENN